MHPFLSIRTVIRFFLTYVAMQTILKMQSLLCILQKEGLVMDIAVYVAIFLPIMCACLIIKKKRDAEKEKDNSNKEE